MSIDKNIEDLAMSIDKNMEDLAMSKGFWSGFVVMVIVPAFYLVAGFIEKLN